MKAPANTLLQFLLLAPLAHSAVVHFEQVAVNDATGVNIDAVNEEDYPETPSTQTTTIAPSEYNGYHFTRWSNSSYPNEAYRDLWGRSENQISFILLEDTIATAHYLPSNLNTDSDDIPDWFEIEYYGHLSEDNSSDTDGDSITLIDEFTGSTHPLYTNSSQRGGVAWTDSTLVTVNLANYPSYTISSIPSDVIDISEIVPPNTTIETTDFNNDSTFGYWVLDGERQEDAWGIAYSQLEFTIEDTDRTAVAYFFIDGGEILPDLTPDAFEYYYYGTNENADNSDTDGDGFTLLEEYNNGTHPVFANSKSEGGIEWADSELVTVNLADFSRYTLTSNPVGSIDETDVVPNGTKVTTSEITATNFAYWTLDGVRQEDSWGTSLRQIDFLMDGSDREAVAVFVDGDSDGDNVDDAFELYHYNTLSNSGSSDTDGDGFNLLAEFNNGTHPVYPNAHSAGGIFWEDSELVTANLQPFERLSKTLIDGVLTDFFSRDPDVVSGISTSETSSTAAGDWDGDGDFDLFVAHSGGLLVFENIGTVTNPNFSEISGLSSLSILVAGLRNPIISAGDWNNDGHADLVIGGQSNLLQLVPSAGNFTSSGSIETLDTGSSTSIPALGDFNNDDLDDLLVLLADGSVRLYLNTGTTPAFDTYTDNFLGQTITNGTSLSVGDINQDGRLDVLASDSDGRIWEFHQNEDGSFTLFSKVWGGSYPGFASGLNLAAIDLEQDGDLDLIAGLANGSILGLRDPRLGRPTGLLADSGADSILLYWNADWQSRIAGYSIQRSDEAAGPFNNLLDLPHPLPTYRDSPLTPGEQYHYTVKSVSRFFLPGNSEPRIVESLSSDVVSATAGEVNLRIRSIRWKPFNTITAFISIDNSLGLSGENLEIQVAYDPTALTPAKQVDSWRTTVWPTGLSQSITFSDDGPTANGTLTIQGSAGDIQAGSGKLFVLNFREADTLSVGQTTALSITSAALYAQSGNPVQVNIDNPATLERTDEFIPGDLTGDGLINLADKVRLYVILSPETPNPTEYELLAGDLNNDGKLSLGDVVLLVQLIDNPPTD